MADTNILVVDDEKEIADLVEIYLVSDGYKVFKANSAEDGLKIIENEDIHLAILTRVIIRMKHKSMSHMRRNHMKIHNLKRI